MIVDIGWHLNLKFYLKNIYQIVIYPLHYEELSVVKHKMYLFYLPQDADCPFHIYRKIDII